MAILNFKSLKSSEMIKIHQLLLRLQEPPVMVVKMIFNLAVWNEDPTGLDPITLALMSIDMTFIGGETVFKI